MAAIRLQRNDEWAIQRLRYMTSETLATLGDDAPLVASRSHLTNPAQVGSRLVPLSTTPLRGTRSIALAPRRRKQGQRPRRVRRRAAFGGRDALCDLRRHRLRPSAVRSDPTLTVRSEQNPTIEWKLHELPCGEQ
jgi:hypothetical protein